MSRRGFYQLDPEAETVEVRVVDADRESVRRLRKWLGEVARWMDAKQVRRDGGKRWEFDRPAGPETEGRYMVGRRASRRVTLVKTSVRKPRLCGACRGPVDGDCWRQKPNTGGGYSRERFCMRCVEDGPPRRPDLRLVDGGLSDAEGGERS